MARMQLSDSASIPRIIFRTIVRREASARAGRVTNLFSLGVLCDACAVVKPPRGTRISCGFHVSSEHSIEHVGQIKRELK